MRAAQSDDVSTSELSQIIKTDPAFVARVVKAANGVLGFGRRPVSSVHDALMVLGLPAVRTLALGFSLLSNYRTGGCRQFDYEGLWSSSLMRAVAMQAIVKRTRVAPPDEAYCIGLLSRIGELALATIYPDQYGELAAEPNGDPDALLQREKAAFAIDHLELGALMLSDWGIPEAYVTAVLHHEHPVRAQLPDDSRESGMCMALALAAQLARFCVTPAVQQPALIGRLLELGRAVGYDAPTLFETCDLAAREWSEWCALLQLPLCPIEPFATLAERPSVEAPAETIAKEVKPSARTVDDVTAMPPRANHMRVLLVESDAALRTGVRAVLDGAGHEVQEADSVAMATELALVMQPHMMIIDWTLPDGSGLGLVERLRQTRMGRSIYVLVLTSHENEQRLVDAFESGVDDFITKPINDRVLLARLRAGLRVVRLHQEVERDREEVRQFASELAISNRRLSETALTDALTGFPNRRHFLERLKQEWSAAGRHHRPLACMLVRVTGFGQIAETYGRELGDRVIARTAEVLKQCLRTHDIVARVGDGEFAVLCPDTAAGPAQLVAQRICRQVEESPVSSGRLQLSISVEIGVAARDDAMDSPDALMNQASSAFEGAKDLQESAGANSSPSRPGGVLGAVMH